MKPLSKYLSTPATALVTGASSGLGLEYARTLAEMGCNLVLVSNQEEQLAAVATDLAHQYGVQTTAYYRDLAQVDAARELFETCESAGLQIDILINNAGIFFFNAVTDTDPRRINTLLQLHVTTATQLCRYFAAAMEQRGYGYILNMSSLAAKLPLPGITLYAASKAYLRSFSKSLRHELRDKGVGVTAICPGGAATDLYGLPRNLQKLGVRLGILKTPHALVRCALKGMFRRKAQVIPGFINRLFPPLIHLLPDCAVTKLKNKLLNAYGK